VVIFDQADWGAEEPPDHPDHYQGDVTLQRLRGNGPCGVEVVAVHFAAGGRTRPHTHTDGQVLHITSGKGIVATECWAAIRRAWGRSRDQEGHLALARRHAEFGHDSRGCAHARLRRMGGSARTRLGQRLRRSVAGCPRQDGHRRRYGGAALRGGVVLLVVDRRAERCDACQAMVRFDLAEKSHQQQPARPSRYAGGPPAAQR